MSQKIYKLWMFRFKEAWYQLSEEEQNSHNAKIRESFDKVGGKTIILCTPLWASEQWMAFGVEEYPDIEAVGKHAQFLFQQNHFRYFESESMLGIEWPPA
jgi:hypothetical protein